MFQALARKSIGSRKYKAPANATDDFILAAVGGVWGSTSEQLAVCTQSLVEALDQAVNVYTAGARQGLGRHTLRRRKCQIERSENGDAER